MSTRQGTYTKKLSYFTRGKRLAKRSWRWFLGLSWWQKVLLIGGPILAVLIIIPLVTYLYYAQDISSPTRLMNSNNTGVELTDQTGQVLYTTGKPQSVSLTPLSSIATVTQHALIASEDKNFYHEGGFSFTSIIRSMYDDIISHDPTAYGGSTLTQQLAKNTLLGNQQTLLRKYQELAIAVAINQEYSKNQILDMYLNSVYFGDGSFGIQDAAETYFGIPASQLDLAQSAILIGVLPSPTAYSPVTGSMTLAKERQATVLQRMVNNHMISTDQMKAAEAETLTYAPQKTPDQGQAPQFTNMVLQELYKKYGEEEVNRSGFRVKTSLNLTEQQQVQTNINNHLRYIQAQGGSDVAAVIVDPTNGELRVMIGTADPSNPDWGQINMATTPRQPGSSFKPVYYEDALSRGLITSSTIFKDEPINIDGYAPLDADKLFRGNVTVRQALNESLNIPSVQVMQKETIPSAVAAAKRDGITTLTDPSKYGLSLALGSAEVPLTEMVNAYAAFADQGQQYPLTTIDSIQNKYGTTIYKTNNQPKQVMTKQGAFLISNILSDYVAKEPVFGNTLTVPGKTVAVKTGTTNNDKDAWTIGYTPNIAMGVWVGNANDTAMYDGGSDMAGPIWKTTMEELLKNQDPSFSIPSGVTAETVCRSNGLLTTGSGYGTVEAYFLSGTEPTQNCYTPTPKSTAPPATKSPSPNPTSTTPPSSTSSGAGSGNGTNTTNGSSSSTGNTGSTPTSGSGGTGGTSGTGSTGGTSTGSGGTSSGGSTGGTSGSGTGSTGGTGTTSGTGGTGSTTP